MKLDDSQQPTQNTRHAMGVILLVAMTLIWGTVYPLTKYAVGDLSPSVLIATRFAMAAVVFAPHLQGELYTALRTSDSRIGSSQSGLNAQLLRDGALLGLVLFASCANVTFAMETICANRGAFIASLNAIVVPLLGLLLGQRVGVRIFLAAGLALTGIGVMCWESGELGVGELLMFGEAFIYSVYTLILEGATQRHPPLSLTAIQLLVMAVLGALWAAPELVGQLGAISNNFSALLYLGLVASAGATWLQAIAQRWVPAHEAALFYTLEPVFTTVFSFWLLGEQLGVRGLVGAALVLAALVLSQTTGKGTSDDGEVQVREPVGEPAIADNLLS